MHYNHSMELIVYIILLIVLGTFAVAFGRPFFRGAPYAPTDKKAIETMVQMANIKPGEKACDIGSGDGRIVFALAEAGADADGIEINPFLVWLSRFRARGTNAHEKIRFLRHNLWKADYSKYDVITLFGITYIMKQLEEKLQKELKSGTRILSNHFSFPDWKPVKKENGVYYYVKA